MAVMGGRRILYFSKNFSYPLGGVRIIHHHVAILARHGCDAYVLLRQEEPQRFFDSTVPSLIAGRNFVVRPTDIFVVPEPWGDVLQSLSRTSARRVVFCQNHFYMPHGLGSAPDYASHGVSTIFCCGEVIAAYVRDTFGIPEVPVVHNAIDLTLFQPAPKRRQIAFMPRKMRKEAEFIKMTFQRRHPAFASLPWIPIEMMPEARVAELLGESSIFLSLSRMEGVGLPPLEAMACGCLVIGFTGGGGGEYASPINGYWCQPDDFVGCADALARACAIFDSDPVEYELRRASAAATAGQYSLARLEHELLRFWRSEVAK